MISEEEGSRVPKAGNRGGCESCELRVTKFVRGSPYFVLATTGLDLDPLICWDVCCSIGQPHVIFSLAFHLRKHICSFTWGSKEI